MTLKALRFEREQFAIGRKQTQILLDNCWKSRPSLPPPPIFDIAISPSFRIEEKRVFGVTFVTFGG
jgi:hypothetical protein